MAIRAEVEVKVKAEVRVKAEVKSPPAAAIPVARPLEGIRVLVVDDYEDNQALVRYQLETAGATVVAAENGVDAITKVGAARKEFDVILMDMQMPIMDGYQATHALRERGYRGPIVAMTAHALDGECEECLRAGCNELIAKPSTRDEIVRRIRAIAHPSNEVAGSGHLAIDSPPSPGTHPGAHPGTHPANR